MPGLTETKPIKAQKATSDELELVLKMSITLNLLSFTPTLPFNNYPRANFSVALFFCVSFVEQVVLLTKGPTQA